MRISELLISIVEKIKGVKENILAAYDVIASKDGKIPFDKTAKNLVSSINSIPYSRAQLISRGGELGNNTIFIDFDGTPLFAYTPEEIMELKELPEPYTTHERLTFVEWNYTLEEIKEKVQSFGWIDVGAMYVPTDGWGEMEIEITGPIPQFTPHFRMWLNGEGTLTMDWGDGTVEEYNGSDLDVKHTYSEVGTFLVRFISTTSYQGLYTYNDTKSLIVGRFVFPTNTTHVGRNSSGIQNKSGGNNPEENNTSYSNPQCLAYTMIETLVIPPTCNISSDNCGSGLTHMFKLKSIVTRISRLWRGADKSFPNCRYFSIRERNLQYGGTYAIQSLCVNARSQFWGDIKSVSNGGNALFLQTTFPNLERISNSFTSTRCATSGSVSLPLIKELKYIIGNGTTTEYWTTVGYTKMYNCNNFELLDYNATQPHFVSMASNINIKDYGFVFGTGNGNGYCLFSNNTSLQTVSLKASGTVIRKIKANTFQQCFSLREVHLVYYEGEGTPIVTLENINAFSGCPTDLKIYVPSELVESYKTATNWSTYADRIVPEIEETEPDTETTE